MKKNPNRNSTGWIALAIIAGFVIIAYLGYTSIRKQGSCIEGLIEAGSITEITLMLNEDNLLASRQCKHGRTPLHFAAFFSRTDMINLFIEKGADANAKDNSNFTPLFYARDADTAKLLIKRGANVNAGDGTGYTSLHHAVNKGKKAIVKVLIKYGADANIQDSTGTTAIGLAEFHGRRDITELIHQERQKTLRED